MNNVELARQCRRSWPEIHAYYQSAATGVERLIEAPYFPPGFPPKSPAEVEELKQQYRYLKATYDRMSEFVRLIREKPALQPLITSGSLGSIFVFRDEQCLAKKGYFLIGAAPRRNAAGEIYLGYFTQANYDPTEFLRFTTPSAAEASFEALLTAHGFLS